MNAQNLAALLGFLLSDAPPKLFDARQEFFPLTKRKSRYQQCRGPFAGQKGPGLFGAVCPEILTYRPVIMYVDQARYDRVLVSVYVVGPRHLVGHCSDTRDLAVLYADHHVVLSPARIDQVARKNLYLLFIHCCPILKHFSRIQQNIHRPIVNAFNVHMSRKFSLSYRYPLSAYQFSQLSQEPLCSFRISRLRKAWPSPFACVSLDGEVAHQQNLAATLQHIQVEFSLFVAENPQPRYLSSQILTIFAAVTFCHAHIDQQSFADLDQFLPVYLQPST